MLFNERLKAVFNVYYRGRYRRRDEQIKRYKLERSKENLTAIGVAKSELGETQPILYCNYCTTLYKSVLLKLLTLYKLVCSAQIEWIE